MSDRLADPQAARVPRSRPLRSLWRRIRQPLARSRFVKSMLARLIAGSLRTIYRLNRRAPGSMTVAGAAAHEPAVFALWHGQHLLAPCFYPRDRKLVAMFSRSADAELNAEVVERLGIKTVRGSGGRAGEHRADKGGARALIQLKRALDGGSNIVMIADIAHGTPRESGLGVVTLAKISGRPILPTACVTSRRRVLEKTWDKTTINLPFGRRAMVIGDPIYVAADASDEQMEAKRSQVTVAMNAAMARAYQLVDGQPVDGQPVDGKAVDGQR